MAQELEPQNDRQLDSIVFREAPVDVTLHRPEVVGRIGKYAVTRNVLIISMRGDVDREQEGPDSITIDGSVIVERPGELVIQLHPPYSEGQEPQKEIEGPKE